MIPKNFLLISLRYLRNQQSDTTINTMVKICFIGIMIATSSLALVVGIMAGFEHVTHQKMQSIYPDLIIDAHGHHIDMQVLQPILQEPQYAIQHASSQQFSQALLYNTEYSTTPHVIFLHGINPTDEQLVTTLDKKIIYPPQALPEVLYDNHIIIGQKLAQQLSVNVNDTIELLYTDDNPEELQVTFQQKKVIIGNIFKTGIDDFDTNFAYCSTDFFTKLFPDSDTTQVYLKLNNINSEKITATLLQQRLNVDVYSWKDLYPTLIATLKLEKYAMFFILLLIVLIASMNIMSLLFMYITQKKKEIALFISFGMPLYQIKLIFITMSLIITCVATCSGLLLAYLIGVFLQKYPFIKLPDDAYLVSHLPIKLDPSIFCVIFIVSLIISLCASILSTNKLNQLNIVKALKQE